MDEVEARSTIGSASDSKSGGWGFKSLRACHCPVEDVLKNERETV